MNTVMSDQPLPTNPASSRARARGGVVWREKRAREKEGEGEGEGGGEGEGEGGRERESLGVVCEPFLP